MTSDRIIPLSEYHRLPQSAQDANFYKRQLEVICNNATLALFIMDEYQRCVYMNPAAEALTGYSLAETQGRALHDVIHHTRPDGSPYPLCECPIDQVFPQNNQEQGEEVFVHKDGHFYAVAYTASPIREGNTTIGTIIEVRDITQEKLDEQARQDARIALASINDGFYTLDRTWQFTYVNDRYCEIVGMSPSELLGQNIWEMFPAAVDTEAYMQFHQAMADQKPHQFDYLYAPWNCWHDHRIYPSPNGLTVLITDITDRKRAEQALQASEEQVRNVLESITDAFFAVDENWQFTYVNQTAYTLINRTPGDLIGKVFWEEFPGVNGSKFEQMHRRVMRDRVPESLTEFYPDHDRWYEMRSYPAENGITMYFRDVTAQVQAENALRQNEERFRTLISASSNVLYRMNADWSEMYELQGRDFIADTAAPIRDWLRKYIAPDDQAHVQEVIRTAIQNKRLFELEHRVRRVDGTIGWTYSRAVPLLDDAGEIVEWFGEASDITDRKQAEADLRASEARYRQLAEAIPQLVWITDAAGQNEYVNQQFCDYTGLAAEQMLGLNWLSIIHPDDLERTRDRWLTAVKSGGLYEIEYRFRRADGSYRWFLGQGIPLKDEQGRIRQWFGTCTDIEPQKQVEQARLRLLEQEQTAREQAETANRIKDEFLAVLSHELRSPLNPILGWSKLLQQGNLDEAKIKIALATIERNACLQAQLIDDLLDISRILRGKLSLDVQCVDLNAVISAALDTVHLAAEAKSLHIQTTFSSQARAVMGDAGRLQQVVWNLLSNAVKFTPPNGQIFVTLTQAGTHAQIQVRDTGKGIKSDFLPLVFEHFRQEDGATTRKFGGLGLGLAIARQIVEMHGGRISVESPGEGQGATFTVQIPFAPQSIRLPAATAPSDPTSRGLQGLRVWVVDDESDSREFVAFVLEQAGAIVTRFASGIEALQAMRQTVPDVIVSDIGMPEMDGYMLMQQIRSSDSIESCKTVPAIALTAYAGEFDRQRAVQAGFQRHVTKPVDPTEITAIVARVFGR